MAYYSVLADAVVMDATSFSGATSATLQAIFDQAVSSGLPLVVRPGTYDAANIVIAAPISVRGVPGKVTFRAAAGAAYILYLGAFTRAEFYGITFDGNNVALTTDPNLQPAQGLVNTRKDSSSLVSKAVFDRCSFVNSTQCGIGIGGTRLLVTDCVFSRCALKSIGVMETDEVTVRDSHFEYQDHAMHFYPYPCLNVTVENNKILGCRRNGIAFEPQGDGKVNQHLTIRNNKILQPPEGGFSVSRTDLATTGAEGNGILAYLCENVVIEGNHIRDCEFSAIRANVTSHLTINGNVCRTSGETAIYVETVGMYVGAFDATITNNVVNGGGAGIAVVNYNTDGRFSTIGGNIIDNVHAKTITYKGGSYGTSGAGIYAEADATVTGNTIEGADMGIGLGTNEYSRYLNATGNVVLQTTLGIGVSGSSPREILVSNNVIGGYSSGAIKAFTYTGVGTPSYTITGAELCPANLGSATAGNVQMIGNVRRAVL